MPAFIDLTGKRFGKLVAVRRNGLGPRGEVLYECRCDCGGIKTIHGRHLRNGDTKSCGCFRTIDIKGRRFGTLVVLRRDRDIGAQRAHWVCVCDCGAEHKADGAALTHGRIKNCGCDPAHATHRLTNHPLYRVWASMKNRCTNPNSNSYQWYGARGIEVCDEWKNDPESFIRWGEANGYRKGLQLDRQDNDRGYAPGNCRWVTPQKNVANSRKSNLHFWRGEYRTEREIARLADINPSTLHNRLNKIGLAIEDAVALPPDSNATRRFARQGQCPPSE